jgi:hypothetical protein
MAGVRPKTMRQRMHLEEGAVGERVQALPREGAGFLAVLERASYRKLEWGFHRQMRQKPYSMEEVFPRCE